METNSYQGLIIPPIVLAILAGLFYAFGVFDVLLAREMGPQRVAMAATTLTTPSAATPSASPPRTAARSSSAMRQPFSPAPANHSTRNPSESAASAATTNSPPPTPTNVALPPPDLPGVVANPAQGSEDTMAEGEDAPLSDEPETLVPPNEGNVQYQPPVNGQQAAAGAEAPQPEMEQPLGQDPVMQEPAMEEPVTDGQEQPQQE
jgi:hypothetical protein